jgi:hypothetical protein
MVIPVAMWSPKMLRVIFLLVLIQWGFVVSYGRKGFSGGVWVQPGEKTCIGIVQMKHRQNVVSIRYFGAVGDGKTLNTNAFRTAISHIQNLNRRGGTLLYIPTGVWLTGTFNLTSHMTLYLAKNAVLKASQVWMSSTLSMLCAFSVPLFSFRSFSILCAVQTAFCFAL